MRNGLYIIGICLVLLGCGEGSSGGGSSAQIIQDTITFTWEPPAINVDGTSLQDLAGYKVYYGRVSGNYSKVIDIGLTDTPDAPRNTIKDLEEGGRYCFTITAYNELGIESGYSNEVCELI